MKLVPAIFLFPFTLIYGSVVFLRNKFFDWNIFRSSSFEIPIVVVGNLSTGGTGKTPHVEFLLKLFEKKNHAGVLSRGYRRRSKGYRLLNDFSTTEEAGDEPVQIKRKFVDATIAVCEDRMLGIPNMIADDEKLEVIILDDAFQHRSVKADLNILLTDYSKLFTRDWLLPSGSLREARDGANRADVIVVSKSPKNISDSERGKIVEEVSRKSGQRIFFSGLKYGTAYSFFQPEKKLVLNKENDVLLFCGIANPQSLVAHLKEQVGELKTIRFADHHSFSVSDLKKIQSQFSGISSEKKFLIATEKDAVRLLKFKDWFANEQLEIYCMPVEVDFGDDEEEFGKCVFQFMGKKY